MLKHLVTLAVVQLKFKELHASQDHDLESTHFISEIDVVSLVNKEIDKSYQGAERLKKNEERNRIFKGILHYDPKIVLVKPGEELEKPAGKGLKYAKSRWVSESKSKQLVKLYEKKHIVDLTEIKSQLYYMTVHIDSALKQLYKGNDKMKHAMENVEVGMLTSVRWEHMPLGGEHFLFGYFYVEPDLKAGKKSELDGKVFLVILDISNDQKKIAGSHQKNGRRVKKVRIPAVAICSRNKTERYETKHGLRGHGDDPLIAKIFQSMRAESICQLLRKQKTIKLFNAWKTFFKGEKNNKYTSLFRYIFTTWERTRYIPDEKFTTLEQLDDRADVKEITDMVMNIEPVELQNLLK